MSNYIQPCLFNDIDCSSQQDKKVVNVASVPQRSPFRYPGGKTWLIPVIRQWLHGKKCKVLIEPFCGGGIVGLTAAAEGLADKVVMIEKDEDVASVWKVILADGERLAEEILNFNLTREAVAELTSKVPQNDFERAFTTIVRNRTNHGGILAPGSGTLKNGENGKGIASRWYPATLAKRIRGIQTYKDKIIFHEGDAFDYINTDVCTGETYYFIDPPYTIAGRRLYRLSDINHDLLFEKVSSLRCHYLMTYDNCDYVKELAINHSLNYRTIPMQTTHLITKEELLISNDFSWLKA